MKRFFWGVISILFTQIVGAQQKEFFIELADQVEEIHPTQTGKNKYNFETASSDFTAFLNQQNILAFEKAYPQASLPRLQKIYKISLRDSIKIEEFSKRTEIKHWSAVDYPDLTSSYPNDYFIDGKPDPALELIRAPQAWHITKGSPEVIVGVVDKGFDLNHDDLKNKIVSEIQLGKESTMDHGTGVAGVLAGDTNNGKGFASIGYHTKMAIVNGFYALEDGLDSISKIPGIRIVNASWGYCNSPNSLRMKKLDTIIKRIEKDDILVVAAAGNGKKMKCKLNDQDLINGYRFPASYDMDNVISVTSVGNKFHYGHYSERFKKSGWRDCHENNPFTNDESLLNNHTHNDRVDIAAPGIKINILTKGNSYDYDKWGTSQATPMVAGTAALMLSLDAALTAKEMKSILLSTADDIYHLPCNEKFRGLLGQGRLNAYRAVLTVKCKNETDPKVDLMIKDAADDFGEQPYIGNNYDFQSPDIWIRNQNDGKIYTLPENPVYQKKKPNYVYVRVTNTGCKTSSGQEKVVLYWGKTVKDLEEAEKTGQVKMKSQVVGEKVGEIKIPSVKAGQETIVEIPWEVPNPKKFRKYDAAEEFYLLAKIISGENEDFNAEMALIDKVVSSKKWAWKKVEVK